MQRVKIGWGSQAYYNCVMAERLDIGHRVVDGVKEVYSWAKKEIFTHLPVRHHYEVMALAASSGWKDACRLWKNEGSVV